MRSFDKLQQEFMEHDVVSGVGARALRLVEDLPAVEGTFRDYVPQPPAMPDAQVSESGAIRKFALGRDLVAGRIGLIEL